MIFHDLIDQLKGSAAAAVKELFEAALAHQTHPEDLLLTEEHGFYSEMHAGYVPDLGQPRVSPYVIGLDVIGVAEGTFYKFVDWYRRSHEEDKPDFERRVAVDQGFRADEELLLQIELSIYLRFWESDFMLKQLHQLGSLCIGERYDWFLKLPRKTGRHEFIRKGIRDRIKDVCPQFYAVVKANYKSQIRNAIAHSQFAIVDRRIQFLNHSKKPEDFAPLEGISFDEWYTMFHTTLLLHNEMLRAFSQCRADYKKKTLESGNRIQIRITDRAGREDFAELSLHPSGGWCFYAVNLPDSGAIATPAVPEVGRAHLPDS